MFSSTVLQYFQDFTEGIKKAPTGHIGNKYTYIFWQLQTEDLRTAFIQSNKIYREGFLFCFVLLRFFYLVNLHYKTESLIAVEFIQYSFLKVYQNCPPNDVPSPYAWE